jgi:hypothetical protein
MQSTAAPATPPSPPLRDAVNQRLVTLYPG